MNPGFFNLLAEVKHNPVKKDVSQMTEKMSLS